MDIHFCDLFVSWRKLSDVWRSGGDWLHRRMYQCSSDDGIILTRKMTFAVIRKLRASLTLPRRMDRWRQGHARWLNGAASFLQRKTYLLYSNGVTPSPECLALPARSHLHLTLPRRTPEL